jgi:hypothetical protein
MAGQTIMIYADQSTPSPPRAVSQNVGEIKRSISSLAQLQTELFKADTQDAVRQLAAPAALLASALGVALGTVPVALLFIAQGLVALTGWPYWLALLIAAVLGFAAAASVAAIGLNGLRQPMRLFARSRDELKRNVSWIEHALARADASPGRAREEAFSAGLDSPR